MYQALKLPLLSGESLRMRLMTHYIHVCTTTNLKFSQMISDLWWFIYSKKKMALW